MTPLHYMLPPEPGKDHGSALCGTAGAVVLLAKNVTCQGCLGILALRRKDA